MTHHDDESLVDKVRRKLGVDHPIYSDEAPNWEPDHPEFVYDDLIDVLDALDGTRFRLNQQQCKLRQLLNCDPELRGLYESFSRSGGVTGEDFRRFLHGELRPKITRSKKHLRLIACRKTVPLTFKKPGNDAA